MMSGFIRRGEINKMPSDSAHFQNPEKLKERAFNSPPDQLSCQRWVRFTLIGFIFFPDRRDLL